MFNLFRRRLPKVTLVLGGGSARGIAHIGVLKVLEREKIPIDRIVGTSIGALVGAAYAAGIPLHRIEEKAYGFTWKRIFDPVLPRIALIEGKKLEKVIEDMTEGRGFADLRIPLHVVTTDIEKDEEVVFTSGNLAKTVRASCSWPGIFSPVTIGGRLLVDGGIKNSVPVKIARNLGPAFIIASDVGFCVRHSKIDNIFQMILQSFQITGDELNKHQAIFADITIKPHLKDIDQAAFHMSHALVRHGVEAAEAKVKEIKKTLRI